MTDRETYNKELQRALSELPPEARRAFALDVAEQTVRLWSDKADRRTGTGDAMKLVRSRLDQAWQYLLGSGPAGEPPESTDLQAHVPDEDDEDWGIGQGLQGNAVLAAIHAMRSLTGGSDVQQVMRVVRQAEEAAELVDGEQVEGYEFTPDVETELWEGEHAVTQRAAQTKALDTLRRGVESGEPLREVVASLRAG